ncbi:ankyrin repeat-containing domain protein [Xylaria sp. FL1777]|nr:ankyrin repeat-containing domain protein [Xylaria sp. FL1777]
MSSKSSKPSDQQWDDKKDLIREWYLVQDKSLKEVQRELKEHGLDVPVHKIEAKIREWKFRKNIGKEIWTSIDHHITKRKRDDKEYEVILCGRRIKPETVTRETDRHRDRSIWAQLALQRNSPPPLSTDSQVAVCTPQPINMEFKWPTTLPWLRFSSRELPMILKACQSFILESHNASSKDLISAILPKEFRTNMARIGVSKLAAIIGRSMPERYDQENLQRAHSLLSRPAEDSVREYLSMIIYNVSNNALNLMSDSEWEQTIKVLEGCGIFRLGVGLRKDKSPTIDGFMEKLYDASIRRCVLGFDNSKDVGAETVVKWLLTVGYCPNSAAKALWARVEELNGTFYGCQRRIFDLTKYLLNAGASANILMPRRNMSGLSKTILEFTLEGCWSSDITFKLAELLFKHGASENLNRALHLAIRGKENDLVGMIVQNGGNLTAALNPSSESPLDKETALTVAASTGLQETWHILNLLSGQSQIDVFRIVIKTNVLIAAAARGHNDIISSLYNNWPTIMADEYGITPLHAAARWGHLSTCQLLLSLPVAHNTWTIANFSPLHAACYGRHKDVVEFLIMNGANVNDAPGFGSAAERLRFQAWFNKWDPTSGIAPLNYLLDMSELRRLSTPDYDDVLSPRS